MTKALVCAQCLDIRGLDPHCAWTTCRCGACSARWVDPNRGTVSVRAKDKSLPRILGMNNSFLVQAVEGFTHHQMVAAGGQWEAWRKLHDTATNAPGYIFDKQFRSCWACVIMVGETGDVKWEPEEEKSNETAK